MCDAVSVDVRYRTVDGNGETRAQRNERFGAGHLNKVADVPYAGVHIWQMFWQLSNRRSFNEHGPDRLEIRDMLDYIGLCGDLFTRRECVIMLAMDTAFIAAIGEERRANAELEAMRSKNNN